MAVIKQKPAPRFEIGELVEVTGETERVLDLPGVYAVVDVFWMDEDGGWMCVLDAFDREVYIDEDDLEAWW